MWHKKSLLKVRKLKEDILSVKVQGATNVAKATLAGILKYGLDIESKTSRQYLFDLRQFANYFSKLRSTEPMAQNSARYLLYVLEQNKKLAVLQLKKLLKNKALQWLEDINLGKTKIIANGQKIIKAKSHILTHCHSSLVEGILVAAKNKGKKIDVYNTETRPLFQGRITSTNLLAHKVKDVMIVDSAAPFILSRLTDIHAPVRLVLLGADAIALNGSCVNKVGSYSIALSCRQEKIPLYIVAQLTKIDPKIKNEKEIQTIIEKRPIREVWENAPANLKIINFAFDIVPASFITGFITEFGIFKPKDLPKAVKKYYKWMF